MKDEIREILDNFKNNYDELGLSYYPEDILGPKDLKLLYDYITNLQNTIEDNEDTIIDKKECIFALETSLTDLQEELEEQKRIGEADFKLIQELEEENKSLKSQLDFIEEQNKYIDKLEKKIKDLQKENMKLLEENEAIKNVKYMVEETIYKSRIDKAIEYIDLKSNINGYDKNKLEKILKGEDRV